MLETQPKRHPMAIQVVLNAVKDPAFLAYLKTDVHTFGAAFVAVGGRLLGRDPMKPSNWAVSQEQESLMNLMEDMQKHYGERVSASFVQDFLQGCREYNHYADDWTEWKKDTTKAGTALRKQRREMSWSHDRNLDVFAALLGWTPLQRDIVLLQVLLQTDVPLNLFWSTAAREYQGRTLNLWAALLKTTPEELRRALAPEGALCRSGMLNVHRRTHQITGLSSVWLDAFITPGDESALRNWFVGPMPEENSSGGLPRWGDGDEAILDGWLGASHGQKGWNILCYGSRSVDKRGLIRAWAAKNNRPLWEMRTKDVDPADLGSVCYVAQRWVEQAAPTAIMVVPKSEGVLTRARKPDTFFSMFGAAPEQDPVEDRDLDERLLEDALIPSVWLTNTPSVLSEASLGRFMYHTEIRGASRIDRREEIRSVMRTLGLSQSMEEALAKFSNVSDQQLKAAVRLASSLNATNPEEREQIILKAIEQSQKALDRQEVEELRTPITHYSLDLLNTAGSFKPTQIIEAMKKRPRGSLCFYGLPGTGKTQLAEHMAVVLDKPILMKRASDLLDKYVGETEKRIADMFREAEEEGAILLLDEADSFLQDRALAQYRWEASQVNELLQRMERYRGIFICATNLFERLDAAALRRFTFKLKFLPLTSEQQWQMFVAESGLDPKKLGAPARKQLEDSVILIPNLTPGDFATVKRQAELLGQDLSPQQWVAQLKEEAFAKSQAFRKE